MPNRPPSDAQHTELSADEHIIAPRRQRGQVDSAHALKFAIEAAQLLHDLHCQDVLLLDVRGISNVTEYILIATGTSDRQIRSVGDDLKDLAKEHGITLYGREADSTTTWVVLDFVEMMAHLFLPDARAHYDLEMLWADAPKIDWSTRLG